MRVEERMHPSSPFHPFPLVKASQFFFRVRERRKKISEKNKRLPARPRLCSRLSLTLIDMFLKLFFSSLSLSVNEKLFFSFYSKSGTTLHLGKCGRSKKLIQRNEVRIKQENCVAEVKGVCMYIQKACPARMIHTYIFIYQSLSGASTTLRKGERQVQT